ncbi:extracellular mutant protein 11-domain-containing protein [Hypoxylon fuscum]|nr:extracellular mutant protein 11-domain-containing protein [Hypoxylon fuscum]
MPPASQFLKHSKTKMQAWVTSNGLNSSQAAPTASGPGPGHDDQNYNHTQQQQQQRHVYLPHPAPPATQIPQTTQATQNSPPRSRAPIVNANSNRAAVVAAARLPVPTGRTGHARDTSLNMSRARGIASEPIQPSRRQGPFWEGSTADGSMFSETASNGDASTAVTSMYRMPFRAPAHQRGETPRPRIAPKEDIHVPPLHPPFLIGPNGTIDMVGGPLTRSASTPDARNHRGGLKGISSSEPEPDQDSEDGAYQTSPEKTPSAKRLHHTKQQLTLRTNTNRRGSFSERAGFPPGENVMSLPPNPAYQGPEDDFDEARSEHSVRHLRVKTQHEPQRSTIFADTDTPMVSHHDESEEEIIEQQPAPQPPPKPVAKPKSVNRTLFLGGNKGKIGGLHESAMPRPTAEKRVSNPKKRQHEPDATDYDDGALAKMDYEELKNEPFDFDPAREEAQSAVGPPRGTLPDKLFHFLGQDQASQMEFFTKMPVKDWEASGDWFLDRFGEVMQRFRDSRQAKRALMEGFENEIAERGEAVRNKIQGIDGTLADFRREGEGMMLGKDLNDDE